MPLGDDDKQALQEAIDGYSFPPSYYDFVNNRPLAQAAMSKVEELVQSDLRSGDPFLVKNGLSNVLYWGYAQIGYRDTRVKRFRDKVTPYQLEAGARIFQDLVGDGLMQIKGLGFPEFSGMSFISKIRMFLAPEDYVVLDQQILKINDTKSVTFLREISFRKNETQIRVNSKNVEVYRKWCKKCEEISQCYFDGTHRAVDIERGFFTLIQNQQVELAASILSKV
jgi:hypothetical protein